MILFLGRETGGRWGSQQQGSQLREVKIDEMQNLGAQKHSEIKHFPTPVAAGGAVEISSEIRGRAEQEEETSEMAKRGRSFSGAANLAAIPGNSRPSPSQLTSPLLRRNRRLQSPLGGQVLPDMDGERGSCM